MCSENEWSVAGAASCKLCPDSPAIVCRPILKLNSGFCFLIHIVMKSSYWLPMSTRVGNITANTYFFACPYSSACIVESAAMLNLSNDFVPYRCAEGYHGCVMSWISVNVDSQSALCRV